jgi:hypothetical protein
MLSIVQLNLYTLKNRREKMPAKRKVDALALIKKHFKKEGISWRILAGTLNVPEGTLRQWLNRGRFPYGFLEKIAEMMGKTADYLVENGVGIARVKSTTSGYLYEDIEILSLVKNIAKSGVSSLSLEQFISLAKEEGRHKKPMPPRLVKELLEYRRSK